MEYHVSGIFLFAPHKLYFEYVSCYNEITTNQECVCMQMVAGNPAGVMAFASHWPTPPKKAVKSY